MSVMQPDQRADVAVMALWAVAWQGSTPLGGPIVGWVGEELGARWSLIVGGVPAFAVGIAAYRVLARIDRRHAERREQTATAPAPAGECLSCRRCTWRLLRSGSRGRAGVGRTSGSAGS